MGPLWKETGHLVTWDIEKAEVLSDFSASVFTASAPVTLPKSQKAKAGTGRMKNHPL